MFVCFLFYPWHGRIPRCQVAVVCTSPDSLTSLWFLQPARQAPTSGLLHLLFPLHENIFPRHLCGSLPPPLQLSAHVNSVAFAEYHVFPIHLATPFSPSHNVYSTYLFVQHPSHPPQWQLLEHGDFCLLFTVCPAPGMGCGT